jgi:sigma-B regulation protein RsbU (phosphoserine phosphatase)
MIPARNVGGDFYDCFPVDDDRMALVIGDVSGKGVPAALFMAIARTMLRAVAARAATPGDCLREVNALLCRENELGMFVTLFYGILDLRTGELVYSNGGHNPPYLLADGRPPQALKGTEDTVLGMLEGLGYHTGQAVLGPGGGLFLYTDGVPDATNEQGEFYAAARLEAGRGPRPGGGGIGTRVRGGGAAVGRRHRPGGPLPAGQVTRGAAGGGCTLCYPGGGSGANSGGRTGRDL